MKPKAIVVVFSSFCQDKLLVKKKLKRLFGFHIKISYIFTKIIKFEWYVL